MSFKGDLSTIGLAEVFQMISMSQKEGTLIVQDAESRKAIYFGPTGVKLVSTGKRKGLRLGDLLVRAGRITAEQLQEGLENSKIQKRMLGEILVESGLVTDADIQQLVREQIEEEIYDLFLWKKANFEFVEGPADESLKDVEGPVTQLSFDVNGLLLEAVRRADEWGIINQKVPSIDSIFTWESPQTRTEEDQSSSDTGKRVYRLIDGQTSVSEIVENTGVPKFEACKILVDLLDRGRIRLLQVQELLSVAQRRLADGQKEKGIRLYMAVGAQAPQDPSVALALARVLETEELNREAAVQYARAGRLFLEQGDLDRALDSMRRASELSPDDLEIRMGLFEAYASAGNLDDGKRLAMELATTALMHGDPARARTLCDRILRADPEDLDFRVVRAKALHRMNQKKELEEELTFIRQKMPVDQRRVEEINAALKEVMAKPPAAQVSHPATKEGPKKQPKAGTRGPRVVALAAVVLVVGGGGAYEFGAWKELGAAIGRANELMNKKDFKGARQQVDAFLAGTFRFSLTQKGRSESFLGEVAQRASTWEAQVSQLAATERAAMLDQMQKLESAISEEQNTSPELALDKARKLRDLAEKARDDVYSKRARDLLSSLQRYLNEAEELFKQAIQLEKENKLGEAAEKVFLLFKGYPNTRIASNATYPLEIATVPAGVRISNSAGKVLGETTQGPLRIRMKDGESVRLVFERAGYVSKKVPVPDKRVGWLTVGLTEKSELWSMPTGFPSTGEPVLNDDILFVADGSRLFAIRLSTQRLIGTEVMESAIIGSPRYANGRVFVAAGTTVAAFEPQKMGLKQPVWKYDAKEAIKGCPGLSVDGALLFVSTGGDMPVLRAIDTQTGMPVWKKPLPADAIAAPVMAGDTLVVGCDDGTVVGLKPTSAEEAWPRLPGVAGYLCSNVSGTYVYLTGVDQSVQAVDAKSGAKAWKQGLPAMPTGRAVRVGNWVYVSAKNGRVYALDAVTGGPRAGEIAASQPIVGGVAASGTLLLFGSDDRTFYCFDTVKGALQWKWRNEKNDRRLRNPPVIKDGVAYFCGEDTLYAIELN